MNAAAAGDSTPGARAITAAASSVQASASLDRSLASGIGWTAVFNWLGQLLSWLIMAYVARVLNPGDFGLAAMAMLFIGLGKMVDDLGLDAVIVQDRALTRLQVARLGGLGVLLGCAFALSYSAMAGPIAAFFGEPAVLWLVVALSTTFITDSLQIVPRALLQRQLAFRRLAWINFLGVAVQSGTLALFVMLGFSYWSLVLNAICSGVVTTAVVNLLAPHRLGWPAELRQLARPIGFGWRMIVSRLAWYGYNNSDSTIIGKVLGKSALGAYQFSLSFATVPVSEVTRLVGRVVPGVFSEVQNDAAALRRYYLVLVEAITLVTLPMCVGLALTADDLVAVVLGPQWDASVAPLRILCGYLAVTSVSVLISHVLIWTGRAHMNMLLNLLSLVVIPLCLYVGVQFGLSGVAWAWLVAFPLTNVPGYWVVLRIIDLRFSLLLRTLLPATWGCVAMSVAVLLLRQSLPADLGAFWRLGAQCLLGATVYAVFMLTRHRDRLIAMYQLARGRGAGFGG